MTANITFFPVGNGDMTLVKLGDSDETAILIDINIRNAADDDDDDACDVAAELRKRLKKNSKGRPYVDAFLLSHPDQDHCNSLQKHFHLGPVDEYEDEPEEGEELKIFIREMWSSPMIFRRASKNNTLCEEAKAFQKEARRRVKVYRDKNGTEIEEGDRIKIIGEDENGKTDGLEKIIVKVDETFSEINGKNNSYVSIYVLGPVPKQELEEDEEKIAKNHSSVILRFSLSSSRGKKDACLFLTGGDAEVAIWEALWKKHKDNADCLKYDMLLSSHHCSWHVLSYDSWSDSEDPKVNADAKAALSQTIEGAFIISSSVAIKDDTADPPCMGAKDEYISILKYDKERFFCTGEHPSEKNNEPLEFSITDEGPQPPAKKKGPFMATAGIMTSREPLGHG
ncbi:MAG: metallohydrolase [Nitrospirae bacterium]|nr:metallohydrolase [Nitrospirota bacterium]